MQGIVPLARLVCLDKLGNRQALIIQKGLTVGEPFGFAQDKPDEPRRNWR